MRAGDRANAPTASAAWGAMYHLSGILGAVSIVAALLLLFELGGCSITGGPEGSAPRCVRVLLLVVAAVGSGVGSMRFHRKSGLDGSRPQSGRIALAEGILMTSMGVMFLLGGFVWIQLSGGWMGLHFAGFVLGGYLTLTGVQRLCGARKR